MKDEYNKAVKSLDLFAGENGVMQGVMCHLLSIMQ